MLELKISFQVNGKEYHTETQLSMSMEEYKKMYSTIHVTGAVAQTVNNYKTEHEISGDIRELGWSVHVLDK